MAAAMTAATEPGPAEAAPDWPGTATPPRSLVPAQSLASLLKLARQAPPQGCFVEVGVYRGGTAWYLASIARAQGREIHLFDTFAGTPEASPVDKHQVGEFADTSLDAVRAAIPDAVFHPGAFPATLPPPGEMPPIAFAHIDCDQYESVKQACIELARRGQAGTILYFDDYDHLEGARRAVDECFGSRVWLTWAGKAYVVLGGAEIDAERDDPDEVQKIAALIAPYTRGRGFDIGTGLEKPYPHMIGVDDLSGLAGKRPVSVDMVLDGADLGDFADERYDFVFSSFFLQIAADPGAALKEWFRVVRPGGHVVLYVPLRGAAMPSEQDRCAGFTPEGLKALARAAAPNWVLVESETRLSHFEHALYQVYRKESGGGHVERPWVRPAKSCLVIRFGGYGDALMAGSILPSLKEQGYHVTCLMTTKVAEVLRHDPHIDRHLLLDDGQIPGEMLLPFYQAWAERHDHVVNLSEAVEGRFLTIHSRTDHLWPEPARRRILGSVNYVEFHHLLAGVPFEPKKRQLVTFYMTGAERAEAMLRRNQMTSNGARPLIAIALSGSPPHKTWPYSIDVVAWILTNTNCAVTTLGGRFDAELERQGARKMAGELGVAVPDDAGLDEVVAAIHASPRVKGRWFPRSARWSMRETLALARVGPEVVIGPETGILNAVSHEPAIEKIVFLSHSSPTNLTRDWTSTTVLGPGAAVPCWPCHRMHENGSPWCPRDAATGAAACAAGIPREIVIKAMIEALRRRAKARGITIAEGRAETPAIGAGRG